MTLPQIRQLTQNVRLIFSETVARFLARISVVLHLGSGSVIGGRAALFLYPNILEKLTSARRVVLVSGTNGKTTTTRMIAYALSELNLDTDSSSTSRYNGRSVKHLDVATSLSGSNLPAGIVYALISSERNTDAVLEVDEGYLPELIRRSHPGVVVLLNLSRDQLDRVNEVRMTSSKWRKALIDAFHGEMVTDGKPEPMGQVSGQAVGGAALQTMIGQTATDEQVERLTPESRTSLQVVANCDDPMIVWAASGIPGSHVTWVSAGQRWIDDASSCPNCGGRIIFADSSMWSCECGFARPVPSVTVHGNKMTRGGSEIPLVTLLPGQFNISNAAMAVTAAALLGKNTIDSTDRITKLTSVAGRFLSIDIKLVDSHDPTCTVETTLTMMLAKNPAGWLELLDLLMASTTPLVIGINAKIADGLDPSWLWDVPFERLAQRPVIATALRGLDLAVRLSYAGVEYRYTEDQLRAIAMAGVAGGNPSGSGSPASIDYVGNYTAFQELRKVLSIANPIPVNGLATIIKQADRLNRSSDDEHNHQIDNNIKDERRIRTGNSATRDSSLRIVLIYPDILGTYGDGGNALILAKRAKLYGFDTELLQVKAGDDIPAQCDIYCIGGGEDAPQAYAAKLLGAEPARAAMNHALSNGAAMLAVCAGYQIIGESFPGSDVSIHPGVALVPAVTVKTTQPRAVGEMVCRSPWLGNQLLTGFENHSGRTAIGREAQPLGRVLKGAGNGLPKDSTEGIVYGNIVGTYMHGPVLARNPALADSILSIATGISLPIPGSSLAPTSASPSSPSPLPVPTPGSPSPLNDIDHTANDLRSRLLENKLSIT